MTTPTDALHEFHWEHQPSPLVIGGAMVVALFRTSD